MKTTEIFFDDFIDKLSCKIEKTANMRGGIFQISEQLFYVLTRANNSYQPWGARKNIIDELQKQDKEWFLVLLSETPQPNYFFTANAVNQIIANGKWNLDKNGDYKTRKKTLTAEYKFITIDELKYKINLQDKQEDDFEKKVEEARKLTREERLNKSNDYPKIPGISEKNTKIFNRNPYVKAEVLERANGKCEHYSQDAPFKKICDETPFLEVHHIVWLAKGGEDTVENAIALCPNCHRGAHFGGFSIKNKNGT